jgi:hypothetical protein
MRWRSLPLQHKQIKVNPALTRWEMAYPRRCRCTKSSFWLSCVCMCVFSEHVVSPLKHLQRPSAIYLPLIGQRVSRQEAVDESKLVGNVIFRGRRHLRQLNQERKRHEVLTPRGRLVCVWDLVLSLLVFITALFSSNFDAIVAYC